MKLVTTLLLILAGMLLYASVFAQDRADIDRTQIIGNRELPKVLIIVPWKKPLPGDLSGRPRGGRGAGGCGRRRVRGRHDLVLEFHHRRAAGGAHAQRRHRDATPREFSE